MKLFRNYFSPDTISYVLFQENGHIEVFDEVPVPGRPKPYAYRSLIQENVLAIEQEE